MSLVKSFKNWYLAGNYILTGWEDKVDFDECWEKHLNSEGDTVTLEMIEKYGIKSVWQIAKLAWEISKHASQQGVQADANVDEWDFSHTDTCTCFVCRKRYGRTA